MIDQAALVSQKFAEAQRLMGENFYHPTMKGLDWAAVSARYAELATHARTPSEFDHVANRLLGELNASHLGIRSPQSGGRTVLPQGRIGVMVSSATGGLRVDAMISDAPAITAKTPLMIGDIITGIDFDPIRAGDTLSSRMAGTIGREVVLSINRTLADGRDVSLQTAIIPVTDSAIGRLAYQATQTRNAKLVDEWSGGRLGYIHIEGMAQPALDEFERDLYAACDGKDGLRIDCSHRSVRRFMRTQFRAAQIRSTLMDIRRIDSSFSDSPGLSICSATKKVFRMRRLWRMRSRHFSAERLWECPHMAA